MNDNIPRILAGYIVSELKQPLTILLIAQEKLSKLLTDHQGDANDIRLIRKSAEALNNMLDQLSDPHKIIQRYLQLNTVLLPIRHTIQEQIKCLKQFNPEEKIHIELDIKLSKEHMEGWIDKEKFTSILCYLMSFLRESPTSTKSQIIVRSISQASDLPTSFRDDFDSLKGDLIFTITNFPEVSEMSESDFSLNEFAEYSDALRYFFSLKLIEFHHGRAIYDHDKGSLYFTLGIREAEAIGLKPNSTTTSSKTDILVDELAEEDLHGEEDEEEENRLTIVVVEDDQNVRNLLKELLSEEYIVHTAENGKLGYEIIQEILPDLVISDLKMPEMDGVELTTNIKSNLETSHIPVILLTAFTSIKDRIRGLKTGADHYFSKPFHSEELLLTIHNDLQNRRFIQRAFFKDASMKPEDMNLNGADKKLLDQAIKIVKENIENPDFQVKDFADALNMATATCNRKLRAITGLTSNQFIRNIKLKEASKMLLEGEFNIGEVAFKVGFVDQRYFSRIFKRQYNVPPREYIKKIKGESDDLGEDELED